MLMNYCTVMITSSLPSVFNTTTKTTLIGRNVLVRSMMINTSTCHLSHWNINTLKSSSNHSSSSSDTNHHHHNYHHRPLFFKSPCYISCRTFREENSVDVTQEVKVKELISSLNTDERRLLYDKLREALLEEERAKREAMWKQYVAGVEDDDNQSSGIAKKIGGWFRRRSASLSYRLSIDTPTRKQLTSLFIYHSLPYVAFGFMDNALMLMAGDYINVTIGAELGLSTMASAALGNAFADSVSIAAAYYVERFFTRLLVPKVPKSITLGQFELKRTRIVIQSARILGIFTGCLCGMLPLVFL